MPIQPGKDELKNILEKKVGVYLLYNSQGENVYIGKSERDLYHEICQQLNRKVEFFSEKRDKILKKQKHSLGEIVHYLSAYEIKPKGMIKNIEALLIRSFANINKNIKMENFID